MRAAGADKCVWPEPCGRFVTGRTMLQRALYQNTSALPTCAIPFGVWIEASDAYSMGWAPLCLAHCCAMRADVGRYSGDPARTRYPDTSTSRPDSCVAGEMRSGPTSGLWPLARYHPLAYNTVPDGAYRLDAACLFSEEHDVMAGEVVDTFPTGTPETVSDDALPQTACGMR